MSYQNKFMLINLSFQDLFTILLILFIIAAIYGFKAAMDYWNKK